MKKNKRNIKNMGQSGAASRIHLSYYNNYPEDDINLEFVNEEEERKTKKRRAAKITLSIVFGVLAILLIVGFFLLREFVFYPDFTKATQNTVTALIHDTEFDFAKFESEGQSKIEYSYDGTSVSFWETHKNTNSNMRITVDDNGEKQSCEHIVSGKEFAVEYGGRWYGASSKNAQNNIAASAVPKLSSAEATYLMNYLNYVAKASDADKDAKITANFIKKVFKESSISECESFYGIYGILGSERYVKSRAYTVTNENLAEFLDNLAAELQDADITVQTSFRNWADINVFKGTKSFSEMIGEIEKYADEIRGNDPFTTTFEVCYTGQELSAILITTDTKISDEDSEYNQIVADFYYNGAMIRTEKKIIKADGSEENATVSNIQITVQASDSSAASYRIHTNTDGVATDIKLLLNNAENTFELTAFCGETEAFRANGAYSDTKEQFDLKIKSVTIGGKTDSNLQLALTYYYKTTDIDMVEYRDILSMSESELLALKENVFDWEPDIPEDSEELNKKINKFFGLDKLIEDAKEDIKKQQEAETKEVNSENKK